MGIPALTITNFTTLQLMLTNSSIHFNASRVDLSTAEALKLLVLTTAELSNFVTPTLLDNVIITVNDSLAALTSLKLEINSKADAAIHLRNTWF